MAKALQCDRCGTCFNPYMTFNAAYFCHFSNPAFRNGHDYELCRASGYLVKGNADTMIDLCPDCTVDFLKFMGRERFRNEDENYEEEDEWILRL